MPTPPLDIIDKLVECDIESNISFKAYEKPNEEKEEYNIELCNESKEVTTREQMLKFFSLRKYPKQVSLEQIQYHI